MMDLNSAIQHCEEVADTPCFTDEEARCYSEHRQLAEWLKELKAYREQSGDTISRNDVIDTLNNMHRYIADELTLCDTGKKFERNEVFIVDDVYEEIAENLPSVNSQPIQCEDAISRREALNAITMAEVRWQAVDNVNKLPSVTPQQRTGQWERMSDLPNGVDDRFKCSRCGNIVHYNNVMNLRTFSRWCGRCGSDNG